MKVLKTDQMKWLRKPGEVYIPFCERLKNARKDAGFTQMRVAAGIGVDRSTVSRWENGALRMEAEDLVRFVRITGKEEVIKYYCGKCPVAEARKIISHGGPSKPTVA